MEPESLCEVEAETLPVAYWVRYDDGVIASAGSGDELPSWTLRLFIRDEWLDGEPVERMSEGIRCWNFTNETIVCDVRVPWMGTVATEMCGDVLVYELLESDWEDLPAGVYEFQPG